MKRYLIVGGPSDPEQFDELPTHIDYEDVEVFTFDDERGFVQLIIGEGGVYEFDEEVNLVTREDEPQYWGDDEGGAQ